MMIFRSRPTVLSPVGKNYVENGIIPDYEVKQKPEDTAKGVDTVLQFTLNLIKDPNLARKNGGVMVRPCSP